MKQANLIIAAAVIGAGYLAYQKWGKGIMPTGSEILAGFIPESGTTNIPETSPKYGGAIMQGEPGKGGLIPVDPEALEKWKVYMKEMVKPRQTLGGMHPAFTSSEQEEAYIMSKLAKVYGGIEKVPTSQWQGGLGAKVKAGYGTPAEILAHQVMRATPPGKTMGVWGFTQSYPRGGVPTAEILEKLNLSPVAATTDAGVKFSESGGSEQGNGGNGAISAQQEIYEWWD